MQIRRHTVFLILVLLTILAYANTTQNGFVWDDELLIVDNSYICNLTYIGTDFTSDLFHNDAGIASHYRPLQTISYTLDYAMWGLNPAGFHATNALLHLGCVLLVWMLVERLSGNRMIGAVAAALFAVHPANTNAVTYIAGRADPMALAATLGSLLLFIECRKRRERNTPFVQTLTYAASVICFVVALFSRESALLLPFLIGLYCLSFAASEENRWREAILSTLPFLLVGLAFAVWRFAVLEMQGRPLHPSGPLPPVLRIQVFFRALATYWGLLFWPARLQMERQLVLGGTGLHVLSAVGLLSLVGLGMLMGWSHRKSALVFFGLCWFAITLFPLMGLLPLNASVAEHWLYLPSVGFYLAACSMWPYLRRRFPVLQGRSAQRLAVLACIVALAALAARTYRRNHDWSGAMSLYSQTESCAPYSPGIHCNLSREYLNTGRQDRALSELLAAEQLDPRSPLVKFSLATVYFSAGDLDKAAAKAKECLQLDPQNTTALLQLATISEQRGDLTQAQRDYIRATASTMAIQPRIQYGLFLLRHDRLRETLQVVDEAFFLEPGNAATFNLLGAVQSERHQFQKAEEAFEMAASLDRHFCDAYVNLGRLANLRGDLSTAAACYRRALRIHPNDARAHYQLAVVCWKRGELKSARQEVDEAWSLMPESFVILQAAERIRRGERYSETPVILGALAPKS